MDVKCNINCTKREFCFLVFLCFEIIRVGLMTLFLKALQFTLVSSNMYSLLLLISEWKMNYYRFIPDVSLLLNILLCLHFTENAHSASLWSLYLSNMNVPA